MMFTTSRYASADTRRVALKLARENDGLFVSRGKRTIAGLADMARKKGEESISIIEEENGIPCRISSIRVSELGNWEWTGEKKL